jgi:hypothetical protein
MSIRKYVYQEFKQVITDMFETTDMLVAFLLSDLAPPRDHDIVYNHFVVNKIIADASGNGNFIFFNTEQLTRPDVLTAVVNTIKSAGERMVEVWDYSQVNVDLLAKEGINARYVPVKVSPFYADWLVPTRKALKKKYDVGFCGILNKRRQDIIIELRKRGKTVRIANDLFNRARDEELMKCRAFINIHFTEDYKVWESIRCEPLLYVGAPVVSENSLDNDPRCVNVPYEELVDAMCAELDKLDAKEAQEAQEVQEAQEATDSQKDNENKPVATTDNE